MLYCTHIIYYRREGNRGRICEPHAYYLLARGSLSPFQLLHSYKTHVAGFLLLRKSYIQNLQSKVLVDPLIYIYIRSAMQSKRILLTRYFKTTFVFISLFYAYFDTISYNKSSLYLIKKWIIASCAAYNTVNDNRRHVTNVQSELTTGR